MYYKRGSSDPVESEATVPGSARSFVIRGKYSIVHLTLKSGLQIRSNRDNLGIIFNISSEKHIL